MPIHDIEIAETFNRMADPFRVRACRNAACNSQPQSVTDLPKYGKPLTGLAGGA